MYSERRLTVLEKKIGPAEQPGKYHILVIEPGQNREQMIEDFCNGIPDNDHLIVVQGVVPNQSEDTDEFQQAD